MREKRLTEQEWMAQNIFWTVVPVPEGSREKAEEALRQVMPAPTPTH